MTLDKTCRWRLMPPPAPDAVRALVHDRCPLPLAKLLAQRGIEDPEKASRFFRPSVDQLHDPMLMADMDKAVQRIERALGDGERIMVYGDYDVDGTTAVALVHSFLSRFTGNLMFYIPDRYTEGYGISFKGIEHAKAEGVGLIIALDCGIKAMAKVDRANELGIDMIICDHHRPGPELPKAHAVLDPKRVDCPYPFKELSGCGIGFKLMQALATRNNLPFTDLEPLLDLVAVSTACDIVPVVDENRVLCQLGLRRLNTMPRPGFRSMLDMANVQRELDVTDLVFIIGPRINAAGRIDHGGQAVELLLAKDPGHAAEMCARVDKNNMERRGLDKEITKQALAMVAEDPEMTDAWSTVLYDPSWHKGVIGIVASRLIETHYRPTIILTESNGKVAGSARSVRGFDVYEAISACSHLLEQFGGHMYAAGMTLPKENVDAFRKAFEKVVRETITADQRVREEEVDVELGLEEVNDEFMKAVSHMAPFGPGNMKPMFISRGLVVDKSKTREVGDGHLKLCVKLPGSDRTMDAIAFRQAEHLDMVLSGEPFSMIHTLEWNDWQNRRTLQLNVKGIKPGVSGLLVGEEAEHDLTEANSL